MIPLCMTDILHNAEVFRKYPWLTRKHLNNCIMIKMDIVQSPGSKGHAERHQGEKFILAAERLSNTFTFDTTAAVSHPSETFLSPLQLRCRVPG